jgi:hypothetical protein
LTERSLIVVVVIQDKNADLLRLHRSRGRHQISIATGRRPPVRQAMACRVSANAGLNQS